MTNFAHYKIWERATLFICIGGLLIGLVACGDETAQTEKPKPPIQTTPPVAPQVETKKIHAHLVTSETRATYQFYCTQCHGVKGKGDGINAKYLVVPPRDHTKADYLETRSDEHLFTAIQQGGRSVGRAPCMPSWGHTLDDGSIHSLVSYIRELSQCKAMM